MAYFSLHDVAHGSALWSGFRKLLTPTFGSPTPVERYAMTRAGAFLRKALSAAPPHWREAAAERWLRRDEAPGPAGEHVVQYLLSGQQSEGATAIVSKGADLFYERQYRQYFNATMGVFAMTAELALLGCGGLPRGALWRRRRSVYAAMIEETDGAAPILVLDHQTVAVPLLLPAPSAGEAKRIDDWLAGRRAMPQDYAQLVAGDEMRCATPRARARRRDAAAGMIELLDAVRHTRRLAILALHPRDPDAMGLHVTLFATEAVTPAKLALDHGLDKNFLTPWREAAAKGGLLLRFLVGGTEEVFTQCSQNLFVKRHAPPVDGARRAAWPKAWSPTQPLAQLLATQFELFQVTVSASGTPGVSPRNGAVGKAAFVCRHKGGACILIPYFAGNAVHGHAAKLWSNPQGALIVWDDHTALSAVVVSGPSRIVAHGWVAHRFPDAADAISCRMKRNGAPAAEPEYWFLQQVDQLVQQDAPLAPAELDPARPTCSIHAAGYALHGKKPAYFAADSLPPYDQSWQHEREAEGRPVNPSGEHHRYWEWDAAPALATRRAHLDEIAMAPRRE